MDFAKLGVNLGIVAGIIGITEVVKLVLPPALVKFVILIPAILGAVAAVALGWGVDDHPEELHHLRGGGDLHLQVREDGDRRIGWVEP
jgi:hypothetical protein